MAYHFSGPTSITHPPSFAAYADPSLSQFAAYGYASPYLETEAFDDPEIDYHLGEGLYMEEDALEDLDGLMENISQGVMSFSLPGIALVVSSIALGSMAMSKKKKTKKSKTHMTMAALAAVASIYALNQPGMDA